MTRKDPLLYVLCFFCLGTAVPLSSWAAAQDEGEVVTRYFELEELDDIPGDISVSTNYLTIIEFDGHNVQSTASARGDLFTIENEGNLIRIRANEQDVSTDLFAVVNGQTVLFKVDSASETSQSRRYVVRDTPDPSGRIRPYSNSGGAPRPPRSESAPLFPTGLLFEANLFRPRQTQIVIQYQLTNSSERPIVNDPQRLRVYYGDVSIPYVRESAAALSRPNYLAPGEADYGQIIVPDAPYELGAIELEWDLVEVGPGTQHKLIRNFAELEPEDFSQVLPQAPDTAENSTAEDITAEDNSELSEPSGDQVGEPSAVQPTEGPGDIEDSAEDSTDAATPPAQVPAQEPEVLEQQPVEESPDTSAEAAPQASEEVPAQTGEEPAEKADEGQSVETVETPAETTEEVVEPVETTEEPSTEEAEEPVEEAIEEPPMREILLDSTFEDGTGQGWVPWADGGAEASQTQEGEYCVAVAKGGPDIYRVGLGTEGVSLKSQDYLFQFDAYTDAPVGLRYSIKNASQEKEYTQGETSLSGNKITYKYSFNLDETEDVSIYFYMGSMPGASAEPYNICLDNIQIVSQ